MLKHSMIVQHSRYSSNQILPYLVVNLLSFVVFSSNVTALIICWTGI